MLAMQGLAILLERMGDAAEAIRIGKLLLKWNPSDNQGMRSLLCNWMLQHGDVAGCLHLFRWWGGDLSTNVTFAYSDVLVQWQRWQNADVFEAEAQRALAVAIRANPFVPDLLLSDEVDRQRLDYVSVGGPTEALSYVQKAHKLWKGVPGCREWLGAQRANGGERPQEASLIKLLRHESQLQIQCRRQPMQGGASEDGVMLATQARKHCRGSALPEFTWPPQLDRPHAAGDHILLHSQGSLAFVRSITESVFVCVCVCVRERECV
jgi:hypothetical protein